MKFLYTYNENDDVTAQYHNSNANPYVRYTYDENDLIKIADKLMLKLKNA